MNQNQIEEIYTQPLMKLVSNAHQTFKENFKDREVQLCNLLSIKTGACPEDCAYCAQSGHFKTKIQKQKLLPLSIVAQTAKAAKARGATRFCMGAAWRSLPKKNEADVIAMIKMVNNLGMESCVTLGMLDERQAKLLADAKLDYYNHNIDTSPTYYEKIITTRTFQDRLDTLEHVRNSGIKVCCGGIMGMGETREDRISFLEQLILMPTPPDSVPINRLIQIEGTKLASIEKCSDEEFLRTLATARIILPKTELRLSAGRSDMTKHYQFLCFFAGANSIFIGDKLLTAENVHEDEDHAMLKDFGLKAREMADAL